MSALIHLRYQKSLEISHKNSHNSEVAAEYSSLAAILHHFVSLIAGDSQVGVSPVAKSLDFKKKAGKVG